VTTKDPRYQDKSPHPSSDQDQPEPERPYPPEEQRREPGGPEDKPSQAEGERDSSAE
jgi:hypothetical protein